MLYRALSGTNAVRQTPLHCIYREHGDDNDIVACRRVRHCLLRGPRIPLTREIARVVGYALSVFRERRRDVRLGVHTCVATLKLSGLETLV